MARSRAYVPQKVDPEKIDATASRLQQINNRIAEAFTNTEQRGKNLMLNWKGDAGEQGRQYMAELLRANEARQAVLDNYIALLKNAAENYRNVEKENTKLSDMFK